MADLPWILPDIEIKEAILQGDIDSLRSHEGILWDDYWIYLPYSLSTTAGADSAGGSLSTTAGADSAGGSLSTTAGADSAGGSLSTTREDMLRYLVGFEKEGVTPGWQWLVSDEALDPEMWNNLLHSLDVTVHGMFTACVSNEFSMAMQRAAARLKELDSGMTDK